MKTVCYLLIITLVSTLNAKATAQYGEILELYGKEVSMCTTPLEDYFRAKRKRPEFPITSTACVRGYIGKWRLWGDQLFLVSIHKPGDFDLLGKEVPLKKLFPSNLTPRLADWYNGVIRVPRGELIEYVHGGYASIYQKDVYLTIKSGKLVAKREIDNKGFGMTRSYSDFEWVFLAPNPFSDVGDWTDGRLLENESSTKWITTRGSLRHRDGEEPAYLYIYETPTTRGASIKLVGYIEPMIREYCHVEVRGVFDKGTRRIQIQSIRRLRPGESIHHGMFQPPINEFDGNFPDWR